MKCRHCGSKYKGGFICPVCGNKNVGKEHCPVCDTVIHHGQVRCSNCGSPTTYAKKSDSIVRIEDIDYTTHSEASHTYKAQENYDYKQDAYQYNQTETAKKESSKDIFSWSKTLKEKQAEILKNRQDIFTWTKTNNKKSGFSNSIVGVFIIVGIIGFIINVISDESNYQPTYDDSSMTEEGNANIEDMAIFGTTSNLSMQANNKNGMLGYLYNNEVYILEDQPYQTNREFIWKEPLNEDINRYVYVDETNIYYLDYQNILYKQIKEQNSFSVITTDVLEAVGCNDNLYYSKTNGEVYKYNLTLQKEELLVSDFEYCLQVDSTTNTLYYNNTSGNITQISLVDNIKKVYSIGSMLFYVEDNIIYEYIDDFGFRAYDLVTEKESTIEFQDVRWFARVENGYLCLLYDGGLYKVLDDGTEIEIQTPNQEFQMLLLLGDKIFLAYEGDSSRAWYVCNYNGQFVSVNFQR